MEFLLKTRTLNESTKIIKWANVLLIYLSLEMIRTLLVFRLNEYQLVSPLVPEQINNLIYSKYVDGGLIISAGFLLSLILKLYKKHFWMIVTSVITMIIFYTYSYVL